MNENNLIKDYKIPMNSKALKRFFFDSFSLLISRLEEEEQTRQKLQIERTQLETKMKNLEDVVASQQNDLSKVKKPNFHLIFKLNHSI
jgi:hypothetical protein